MEQSESAFFLQTPIRKLLPKFAVPCVVSLLISCLYNIVDQIFVGNGVGYLGNAATGIIFPITVVGWGASLLFGDGAAAFMSLCQGRGETSQTGRAIGGSALCSLLSGVIIALVCYVAGDGLLMALGATDATIALAREYGDIIFAMMPLALAQNTLAAIIRADGSPRFAMLSMAVGAVLNIIGDPIAIFALHWGIAGAAWATIFGQFVSFVLCAVYLARSKTFRLKLADFRPRWAAMKQVLPLGGSSFLTQLSIVIVTVVNNRLLVYYGAQSPYGAEIPLAAFVVIMKLFQIVLNIAIGIAAGAQPIIGYNYGAEEYGRVRQTFRYVLFWTLGASALATLAFEVFPYAFIAMFGSSDGALYIEFSVLCLRVYLSLLMLTCVQKACAIFLQSIGRPAAAIPLSIIRDVVLLVLFSVVLPIFMGVTGIFWAAPIADVLAIAVTVIVVVRIWRRMDAAPVD